MTSSHLNRIGWENRSVQYGTSLKSVLFKGLPDVVNEHISVWHTRFILNNIEEKEGLSILDVGCGYGRLSLPVIEKFPNTEIIGIDISETFVGLFRKITHQKSFVGNIEEISRCLGQFDYIICVTVLMYIEKANLYKSLRNLIDLLKPEGRLIVIENYSLGISFLSCFGIFPLLKKLSKKEPVNTHGRYFKTNELDQLFAECHAMKLKESRFPFTTFFILPVSFLGKFSPPYFFIQSILKILSWLDRRVESFKLPSLHIGYIIKKQRT